MFEGCGGCCLALILIPVLCCVMVACGVIYVYNNGPEPPLKNFKPKQADAQAFDAEIQRATAQAASGWFYVNLTEQQMSSWLALKGENFAHTQNQKFPFKNVQVKLDNGKMIFYGELSRYSLKLPLRMTIKPGVDSKGKLSLKIETVDFGGLSVPGVLLKSVTRTLEDALVQPIEASGHTYSLFAPTLVVANGVFQVQGQGY